MHVTFTVYPIRIFSINNRYKNIFCFHVRLFLVFCLLYYTDGQVSVLVVGLGGGGLPQFIRDFVPSVQVEVLELDPAVQEVAKTWFGFQTDDRLKVIVGDGLEHISTLESEGKFLKCIFF